MWRPRDARRWLALPGPERRRLLRAILRLAGVDLRLRLFGYSRVAARLSSRFAARRPPGSFPPGGETEILALWVRAVDVAARHHLYPMLCLPRALALQSFLAEEGIETEIRFGVSKEGAALAAHAWVEHRGTPIGESPTLAERFAPLIRTGGEVSPKATGDAFC